LEGAALAEPEGPGKGPEEEAKNKELEGYGHSQTAVPVGAIVTGGSTPVDPKTDEAGSEEPVGALEPTAVATADDSSTVLGDPSTDVAVPEGTKTDVTPVGSMVKEVTSVGSMVKEVTPVGSTVKEVTYGIHVDQIRFTNFPRSIYTYRSTERAGHSGVAHGRYDDEKGSETREHCR
jgi:hypothetical protein